MPRRTKFMVAVIILCAILCASAIPILKRIQDNKVKPVNNEILPRGSLLCDAAFASDQKPTKRPSPIGPVVVLHYQGDMDKRYIVEWDAKISASQFVSFHNTTYDPQEVRAIVCIRPEGGGGWITGSVEGFVGSRSNFDVRLIQWPNGEILEAQYFQGGNQPNWEDFATWVESLNK